MLQYQAVQRDKGTWLVDQDGQHQGLLEIDRSTHKHHTINATLLECKDLNRRHGIHYFGNLWKVERVDGEPISYKEGVNPDEEPLIDIIYREGLD